MVLVLRVAEVLDLCHREFAHSEQSLSRGNLVSETKANLCSCEWHPSIVELNESLEVDENSLGSLRPKISFHLASGPNLRVKHEVEGLCLCELIASVWVLYLVLQDDSINFLGPEVVNVLIKLLKLLNLLCLLFLLELGNFLCYPLLNQFISASRGACLDIFNHQILKLVNVPGGLEHIGQG